MHRRILVAALATLALAACGRDAKITEPTAKTRAWIVNAVGVDSTTGATISTDLDDYVPGTMIRVTGSSWAPNDTVHLNMTESPDVHPDVAQDVVADSTGAFSLDFYQVQDVDLGVTFTLTATGQASGSNVTVLRVTSIGFMG